ncbi:MAG: LURP-one-related family protein [Clostridia bacterium]|nr:LURP-one-related family protein [Clostridia bacterium]MBR5743102.1 LURP-one-related family protein [Clostridia bacterium]
MTFYIKQKVFSWRSRFSVTDGNGADRYAVTGEILTFGRKLHVTDPTGRERLYIKERLWTFLSRYELWIDGACAATIRRDFTFFRPHYTFEGTDLEIEGDFWQHDYRFLRGGVPVGKVKKAWFTWGDFYELTVEDPALELLLLGAVIVIDSIGEQAAAAAGASAAATSAH